MPDGDTAAPPEPTQRFTDRASAYHAHRPRYTGELIAFLASKIGLVPDWVVADIGSGTGISAEPFLLNGNTVFGIEPNVEMRAMGERNLAEYPAFHSVAATAETTTLADASVDLVIAGQAFHWFRRDEAAREFARILRPGGWIVLMWNERLADSSPFARAYENALIQHGLDYTKTDPKKVSGDEKAINEFLGPKCQMQTFQHSRSMTFEDLVGLASSASYAPLPGHPKHRGLIAALRAAFDASAVHGTVPMEYILKVYYARSLI
jgi:ubiquinone/menaquinone biosynthesis C-methylase UbiE